MAAPEGNHLGWQVLHPLRTHLPVMRRSFFIDSALLSALVAPPCSGASTAQVRARLAEQCRRAAATPRQRMLVRAAAGVHACALVQAMMGVRSAAENVFCRKRVMLCHFLMAIWRGCAATACPASSDSSSQTIQINQLITRSTHAGSLGRPAARWARPMHCDNRSLLDSDFGVELSPVWVQVSAMAPWLSWGLAFASS